MRPREVVKVARPGNWERLEIVEEELGPPGPGQVQIEVSHVGVNFADCVVRMGLYASAKKYVGYPITPGFEAAGRVAALGPSTDTELVVGQEVFALQRFGGYASLVNAPASQVFAVGSLSLAQAASFSVAGLTAWYALTRQANAGPGQRVLVHSAAGGVGLAAVQIAQALGAEVVGIVGGSHKTEEVARLGAKVVDKSSCDWVARVDSMAPTGFDVVLDPNGAETLTDSYRLLRPTGRLVIYGFHTMFTKGRGRPNWLKLAWDYFKTPRFDPLRMTNDNKGVLAFNLSYLFDEESELRLGMQALTQWLEAGKLTPLRVQRFPFRDVQQAHRALEGGQTTGKLVLEIDRPLLP